MADKITLDEYKGMTPAAKGKVSNETLAALMGEQSVAYDASDTKSQMLAKLDTHIANAGGGNAGGDVGNGVGGTSGEIGANAPNTDVGAGNNEADANKAPNGVVDATGTNATPAASGNGDHLADTVPPAPVVGGTPVENDGQGQGRVEAPDANTIPADAPVAAVPQAEPGTPDHHDAYAEGQGPGGTTLDPEVAKRTGAAIADPDDEARVSPGDQYVNDLARREAGPDNSPSHIGNTEADNGEAAFAVDAEAGPSHMDLLRNSMAISAGIAAAKAPPVNPDAPKPVFEETLTGFDIVPGPNEKINDAIGSTHDVGGREVVEVSPDAAGLPVYVGTAQPVEQPNAQWRANTAS